MASPQLENGYVKIANEIVEAFARTSLQGEAWRVLMVIIRKTYGFNQKEDWIALSQFTKLSNMRQSGVCRSLKILIERKIIVKKIGHQGSIYSLQKDYSKWSSP